MLFIASVDVGQHVVTIFSADEERILLEEADESIFLIVNHFFPEVIALLVALAWSGGMDGDSMGNIVQLETK